MKKTNFAKTLPLLILLIFCSCEKQNEVIPSETNDETELFYYSKRAGVNNIYKSDLAGNETPIIVDVNHHDWWVRISPDQSRILWYKSPLNVPANKEYNNYKAAQLWMANIDGTNPEKIIDLADNNWSAQGVADWSPNGTELVMAVTDSSEHWHIYISDADGSNQKRISQRNSLYLDPSWSPDGEKIVCSAFPEGYVGVNLFEAEIHIMDKDGSNELQLTDDELRDHDPYWSPDGTEIAFESQWNLIHCLIGKWSLRTYNFETNLVTDLLKDDNANGIPRWSKDSKMIYFARTECATFSQLTRIERDGSNIETILKDNSFPYYDCDLLE